MAIQPGFSVGKPMFLATGPPSFVTAVMLIRQAYEERRVLASAPPWPRKDPAVRRS